MALTPEKRELIVEILGQDTPLQAHPELMHTPEYREERYVIKAKKIQPTEQDTPLWIVRKPYANEVDVCLFVDWFIGNNNVNYINGQFYLEGERVTDSILIRHLLDDIEVCAQANAQKMRQIVDLLAMKTFTQPMKPLENSICFRNLTYTLYEDKDLFLENGEKPISLDVLAPIPLCMSTIPHDLEQLLDPPERFLAFLNELFLPEDVPTIQQYLGYCLMPHTRVQKALFLIGNGGEGKSRLTYLMQQILGEQCVVSNVGQIGERFFGTVLENKLLFIDDDLQCNKFADTNTFKSLVTNECDILVEPKGKEHYTIRPYAKFLLMGNQSVGSLHDRTEGFYRRVHIIKVPPRRKERENDPNLMQSIWEQEKNQIMCWLVRGAIQLARQNYVLTESESSRKALEELKISDNTALEFLKECNFVYGEGYSMTSSQLTQKYKNWCMDNDVFKVSGGVFKQTCEQFFEPFGAKYKAGILTYNGRARGYKGVTISY